MAKEQDERVGRWVIEKGLITARQLQECLSELDQRYKTRTSQSTTTLSLGSLLVEKGFVHPADIKAATGTSNLPAPDGVDGAPELPDEVKQARRFKDSRYGKYTILKLIATGGMGAVYRAWDNDLNRIVAIKFLTDTSDESINRFMREAQTAARLSHPNITQIYDLGKVDGRHYIAMEYIEGITLDNIPESARSVEIPKILGIMADVAFAVDFAHGRGIVHRDLKPQNVILDSSAMPHIMDFGLARMVAVEGMQPSASRREVTASGTIVGTPNYLSPEQARGDLGLVGPRSDIYSLGATLYALLTGVPPFVGETGMDVVLMVLQQEPVPPRNLNPHIPRDVETIILRALQKDPVARYPTAKAFGVDLKRFLNEEPILARRPGFGSKTLSYFRRRPFLLSGIVIGAVLLTLGPVTYYVVQQQQVLIQQMLLQQQEEEQRARDERRRRDQAGLDLQAARSAIAQVDAILQTPTRRKNEAAGFSKQALEHLRKVLDYQPLTQEALVERARLYALIELPDLAVQDLDRVIRSLPGRNDLVLERGRQHFAAGLALIDAYTLPPGVHIVSLHLPARAQAQLDAAAADFEAVKSDALSALPWLLGYLDFANKNRLGAIEKLQPLSEGNADVTFMLALCHLWIGETEKALAGAIQASTLRPKMTEASLLRVAALLRLGRADGASAVMDAIRPEERDLRYTVLKGHLNLAKGPTSEATFEYTGVLERHPQNAVALISRALAYGETEKTRAMADLSDAVAAAPELAPVGYSLRARLRVRLEDALADADLAVNANALYAPTFFIRADIKEKMKDFPGAREDRERGNRLMGR